MTKAKLNQMIALAHATIAKANEGCEAAIAKGGECSLMRLVWSQRFDETEADRELEAAIDTRKQAEKVLEALRIFEAQSIAVKVAHVPTATKAS